MDVSLHACGKVMYGWTSVTLSELPEKDAEFAKWQPGKRYILWSSASSWKTLDAMVNFKNDFIAGMRAAAMISEASFSCED